MTDKELHYDINTQIEKKFEEMNVIHESTREQEDAIQNEIDVLRLQQRTVDERIKAEATKL